MKWYNVKMADNVFFRGERPILGTAAAFLVPALTVLAINSIDAVFDITNNDAALDNYRRDFFESAVLEPLKEEALFRLLPLILISASGNNKYAYGAGMAWATFGFAGWHWTDFDPLGRQDMLRSFAGAAFMGLAMARGVSHSLAAHSGINAGIWASAKLL